MSESVPKKRIMRAKEVEELVGFSRTTLWRRIRDKQFPAPLRLGGSNSRAVGWRVEEIDRWIADLQPSSDT